MANVTIVFPVPYVPTVAPSFSRLLKVPQKVTCPSFVVPPFIGSSQNFGWNCNRCGSDDRYFALFKHGDVIPFQAFAGDSANPNPLVPTIGFLDSTSGAVAGTDYFVKIELYDYDCVTVLYDQADQFCSDYWVGFNSTIGTLQTFFVDTSLLPLNQEFFRIKLTTYNPAGVVVIETWTEVFRQVACSDQFSVLIESEHAVEDCLRHQYLVPEDTFGPSTPPPNYSPTPFYLSWRYAGELVYNGIGQERTENDNNKVIENKVRKLFELSLQKIPPYAAEILSALITGNEVRMDAGDGLEVYEEFSDVTKGIERGTRMWLPSVACSQICDLKGFKCDD